jgi:hypothetical protein
MKPDQNENTISLNIRFPDSKVHNWIFNKFATIEVNIRKSHFEFF